MFFRQSLFIPLILAMILSGCTKKTPPSVDSNAPVIIVNGRPLSVSDFAKLMTQKLRLLDSVAAKDPSTIKKTRELILRDFIISSLLQSYASTQKLSVSPEEVNGEFDRIRKTYPDDLAFKASLAEESLTLERWKSRLADTLLEKKAFDKISAPPEDSDPALIAEARKYYEAHKSQFQKPAQIHIQQIVVQKEDEAERLYNKIKSGGNFAELAKKWSTSPDAADGGDIGYINKGILSVFDQGFNMKIGQYSGVLKSSYGFHIIKLLDKKAPETTSFERAKTKLIGVVKANKQQEAFSKWLEATIRSSKIERNDGLLEKIVIRTEGS